MSPVVTLYFYCKEFGSLPMSGGILDQPRSVIDALMGVSTAFKEHETNRVKEMERKLEMERRKAQSKRPTRRSRHG